MDKGGKQEACKDIKPPKRHVNLKDHELSLKQLHKLDIIINIFLKHI